MLNGARVVVYSKGADRSFFRDWGFRRGMPVTAG
jgi:hypothetical protein